VFLAAIQLSSVHTTKSGPGRLLRLTVEIPTDLGPLGVTVVEVKRSTPASAAAAGPKFVIAAIDDRSFAAQYAFYYVRYYCFQCFDTVGWAA